MKLGLSETEYRALEEHLIYPLKKAGARVWCFGSRARGDHRTFSDLDIMVESSADVKPQVSAVREYFIESQFPFKVDIVCLEDFADSYREGYLRDRVEL